ncbi:lipoprotein insertase outer membrane protein LolB [Vibrio sp.]|uniref:lipoprotein insertase outer membrane protein LolB n=1 Tax=Vibrio sp. TaxID=678 RepID=UPI003D0EFA3E
MLRSLRQLSLYLILLSILAGCATAPESTTNVEWQAHQLRLKQLTQYQAVGKLGYISPEERQSLNFQWSHSTQGSQLRLTNFLGQTVLQLHYSPLGARIETYDDQQFQGRSADQLVYQLTGLTIPVEQLHFWLLGLPDQADQFQLTPANTLASIDKQLGPQNWHLQYLRYQDYTLAGQPLPLPQKLKLSQAETSINIVISKWTLTP